MVVESKFMRIITFFSQLATIESSDDMENLLNAYALPIGSSSIKRQSSCDISINGYVGLSVGYERTIGNQNNIENKNIGLSAPIGLAITLNGCLTFFASFIDIGSIVNQSFGNNTTYYTNFRFEQFFTPGIGMFFNFSTLPITIGFHYNYIPNLRTIKFENGNANITESNLSVSRFNLVIHIDIPLFTIYNKHNEKWLN